MILFIRLVYCGGGGGGARPIQISRFKLSRLIIRLYVGRQWRDEYWGCVLEKSTELQSGCRVGEADVSSVLRADWSVREADEVL